MAPPNVKIKHITRSPSSSGDTRFPKLDECAHFHYENVELGPIKVLLCDKTTESNKLSCVCSSSSNKENEADHRLCFLITVISNSRNWMVRRSYKNFVFLDTQLHRCVYDRKYSLLKELPNRPPEESENEVFDDKIRTILSEYLERFSQLAGSLINCGPVLNWFELDNRGNRLIVTDEVAINTPAVAAAYVIVPHSSQATDEISFDVGDMISVIDMPPAEESSWWRGKKGFEVGFFPSECVEVIGDKVPHSFKLTNSASTKPVFRRHGKLIAFFRSFLLSRPSRRKLKQSGILKERVFGCDLGEHLLNTGRDIPMVLKCCAEFIEEFGVVDGIYRLSGVSSNIQRLRLAFDEDRPLNLGDPATVHDIHSVASLLKMYFRELPNPLLTYQLYDKFVSAVQSSEDVRLLRVRDVVQQLPPPHFRTLQYLLSHLARVASHGDDTGMTPKNIAIVWAPNLLRSREVENGGVGALHVVGVQAVLTEYLIRFSDLIFEEKMSSLTSSEQSEGYMLRARPKSLAISTPTKLLSLEEARARALSTHLPLTQQKYIEVGGGPDKLPAKYHTVIELPHSKNSYPKLKKSPSGWKSFFSRGWYSGSARDKSRQAFRTSRKASTGSLPHPSTYMQEKSLPETDASYSHRKKLRTVKSAESLAHCLKEASQSANKEDFGCNSHRSSPQVSTESSNSSTVVSPMSKSPGLQKHTRSSSHESYFESNSMDIMSDPSFDEDEHGLFYYVSEQMRMLQDTSSSPWHSESRKTSAVTENRMEGVHEDGAEKNARKQKSSAIEDVAQAKVQKLHKESPDSVDSFLNFQTSEASKSSDSVNSSPKCEKSQMYQDSDNNNSMWQVQQSENLNEDEGLTIDPMVLYDAIMNKRCSVISSSDTENDVYNRTVVERYGNAETVLVEVHATQDSSSEEEQCINFTEEEPDVEFPSEVLNDNVLSDLEQSSAAIEPVIDLEEKFEDSNNQTEEFFESPLKSPSPLSFDDISMLVSKEEISYPELVEVPDSQEDNLSDTNTTTDTCDVTSVKEEIFHLEDESPSTPSDMTEDIFKDIKLRREHANLIFEPLLAENKDLPLKCEKNTISQTSPINKSPDASNSFSINKPPSPVYPPKSLKLPDFQSLKTKMETVPVHKKKHIIIPSPSSPVEEVRKKFELHAPKKTPVVESPVSEAKSRREVFAKKSLDTSLPAIESLEAALNAIENIEKKKQQEVSPPKSEVFAVNKRHSEPPPKTQSSPPLCVPNRMSSKYESEVPKIVEKTSKPKVQQQPSLFTQLKIRKLQSVQSEAAGPPPESIDPWSDPILDTLEDYHPIVYSPSYTTNPLVSDSDSELTEEPCKQAAIEELDSSTEKCDDDCKMQLQKFEKSSVNETKMEVCETDENETTKSAVITTQNTKTSGLAQDIQIETDNLMTLNKMVVDSAPESEAVKRERINRIKEERRAQLREKLKPESFRLEAEEKEKVQTKFRLRKDCVRYSSAEDNCKDIKKSDKAVETDSTEIGVSCDFTLNVKEGSNSKVDSDKPSSDSSDFSTKLHKDVLKIAEDFTNQSKTKKSSRSYDDSRKWLSMPSTDIRDKVAMFERSKETKEICRLGPSNGKFIQKQSPSALASSFVR